jgi:hypothetical protein
LSTCSILNNYLLKVNTDIRFVILLFLFTVIFYIMTVRFSVWWSSLNTTHFINNEVFNIFFFFFFLIFLMLFQSWDFFFLPMDPLDIW